MNQWSMLVRVICVIGVIVSGCSSPEVDKNAVKYITKRSQIEKQTVSVVVQTVCEDVFLQELNSNGHLIAAEKAAIPFKVQEQIIDLKVNNGQRVTKGQEMAQVESFQYKKAFTDCQNLFEKARIDLEDQILGYSYSMKDTATMPPNLLKIAKIRSGYNQALSNLSEAKYNFDNTTIRAPFEGVVSNLEAQVHNPSSAYEKCCEVINDAVMVVEFSVLESEMSFVEKGSAVELVPYALPNKSFIGHISSVNPSIDENGMIEVKADVNNPEGKLVDGMNTKVIIKKEIKDCIVIPKSAVLYRQNRKVVFVHEDGLAKWVYVEVGEENSTHVTITDGSLKPGQEVIISNNLNLAHETAVSVFTE
ncbi:efflux RND transporter periplasmic adaptor subunit [Carboxylicivirga sp. N1Y90]|uniref:efflux RND transporter periplasmic adaptor subunit n=1 Tax=Carboxylicivirga fragile TaxID=3417571 RepID=UPI003D340104|nr:efflux RND transporter periplasmic adaptor subunit [Marinilabiliaceae bacterium N1Y90]